MGKLTLDNSDYKKKIDESKKQNEELAENTKKNSAKSVIAWTAIVSAVVIYLNKIKDLIFETANYADQIGDLAEKWGFTTKQIQEFDYWATLNGTTLESLLTGMRGLVNQAEAGANAFKILGVSVRNNDGTFKEQRDLFLETIDALQKVEDKTLKNALQFEIFGRAGIELGQIINLDAKQLEELSQEAEDLGIILSQDTIKQASDFNDNLDRMRKSFKSVMAEIVAGSPDAVDKFNTFLDDVINNFNDWIPRLVSISVNLFGKIINTGLQMLAQLPTLLLDTFLSIDWIQLGIDIATGILKGFVTIVGKGIGYGWLWGKEEEPQSVSITPIEEAITTISNSQVSERTTKIDETLEITLNVESDGTVAGDKNLDTISDLLIDKINKSLGDMIDG